ncbi:MAG: RidA family protein [Rhizobiales bacterium]|nr:RidA family protein [Hyphomicrobiales bacterium]
MHRALSPAALRPPFARYSHGVVAEAPTRFLFTSGQLGVGDDDVIPADVEAQATLCFENIRAILAEGGMTFGDVVRFSAYVTDRAYFPIYGRVRDRYAPGGAFASTLIVVSGFTREAFKIEVEATAAA